MKLSTITSTPSLMFVKVIQTRKFILIQATIDKITRIILDDPLNSFQSIISIQLNKWIPM